MSGNKSLKSFAYRFRKPPGLRLAFGAAERNGKSGRIQCQRSEKSSNKGRKEESIPLQKDSKGRNESKVIPTSFLEIEGRSTFVEKKDRGKGDS